MDIEHRSHHAIPPRDRLVGALFQPLGNLDHQNAENEARTAHMAPLDPRDRPRRRWSRYGAVGLTLAFAAVAGTSQAFTPNQGTAPAVIGTTDAQIHANFPAIIRSNLSKPSAATILAGFSTQELQDLTYAYARNTGGNTTDLAAIISTYAPAQMARYQAAQTNAINGYSGVNPAHDHMYLRASAAGVPPSTGLDSTLQEIYLDFRTFPGGSLGPTAAAWETCTYAIFNLSAAYGAGYVVGSGLNWLL